jgi:hypothetical protein
VGSGGVASGKVGKEGGSLYNGATMRVAGDGGTTSVLTWRCFFGGPHQQQVQRGVRRSQNGERRSSWVGLTERGGALAATVAPIPLALTYLRRPASDEKQKGKEGGGGEVVLVECAEKKKVERGSVGAGTGRFNGSGSKDRRGGLVCDAPHGGRS